MASISILLIDDHALFRTGMSLVLKADIPDVEVHEAASLEQAERECTEPPTLVLLDIQLQGINGIEALGVLKKRWPQVPVIMLSSVMEPDVVCQALSHGAAAFVSKADTAKKIVQVIYQTLDKCIPHQVNGESQSADSNQVKKPRLTPRQCEVLSLLCEGLSNKVMARRLDLSEFTVRGHVQAIFTLMKVSSRSQAMFAAHRSGMVGR
jgi:DNA-binding NarL/FixJ family response regulator